VDLGATQQATYVKYKNLVGYEESAVMIIRNKFNNETSIRLLPSTVDSEEDQLKCHRGILDIEAEKANTLDIQAEQQNEFKTTYAHPGYLDFLSVNKSARVRPIRTGDDYDTERVKGFKQKVKKTTKVTIEPSSMIYVTTLNSRQIRRRHNSQSTPVPDRKSEESKTQTPILLEPIQEFMKNVEVLEESSVNEKTSLNYQKIQK